MRGQNESDDQFEYQINVFELRYSNNQAKTKIKIN